MKRFLIGSAILISLLGMPAQNALGDANEIATPSINAGFQASISAGAYHTCAVLGNGAVKCWGRNDVGQLGNRSNVSRSYPVQVAGLTAGVIGISAGRTHTCAVTISGAAKCWGDNQSGQLGNGSNIDSNRPVAVRGLNNGVSSISAGSDHTCAVLIAGGVKCWGAGGYGRLGDGSNASSNVPLNVVDLGTQVKSIAAGGFHTCALLVDGVVKCWGRNRFGQIGDGTTTDRYTPTQVTGLSLGATQVTAEGSYACAVLTNGSVSCWGYNSLGNLGDGTTTNRYTPTQVLGLTSGVSQVIARSYTACALLTTGSVKCWGYNNNGQIGDGTATDRYTPTQVSGLTSGVERISVGGFFACSLLSTGTVKCWGDNSFGKLGDGSTTDRYAPVDVLGL